MALLWGALMARSRFLEQASTPVAVLIQVTPIVAYAPTAVLWLGRGLRPIVFITGLICLVPLLFAVTTGLRSADPAALDLMAVVDAPEPAGASGGSACRTRSPTCSPPPGPV